jgi:hypothetical protein
MKAVRSSETSVTKLHDVRSLMIVVVMFTAVGASDRKFILLGSFYSEKIFHFEC